MTNFNVLTLSRGSYDPFPVVLDLPSLFLVLFFIVVVDEDFPIIWADLSQYIRDFFVVTFVLIFHRNALNITIMYKIILDVFNYAKLCEII